MPFGDLFKLPEGFKRPRSAPNRMEGLTFPQKLNYMGQFEGPSLMALGAGIASGHPEEGWRDMAKIQAGYQGAYADEAEKERTRQQTMQYLIKNGFDPQQAEAASQNPEILKHIFNLEEEKARVAAGGKVFGTPIYGTDAKTGKTGIGSFDDQGQFHVIDTGDFEVSSGIKTFDTPTEVITVNMRNGEVISREPKDIAGAEREKKIGEGQGTAISELPAKYENLRSSLSSIDDLYSDPALDRHTGTMVGAFPSVTQEAVDLDAKYAKVKGQSFLAAYDQLRGGGSITEAEGQAARDALMAINPRMSATAIRKQLAIARDHLQRGFALLEQRAGKVPLDTSQTLPTAPSAPAAPGGSNGGFTIRKVR